VKQRRRGSRAIQFGPDTTYSMVRHLQATHSFVCQQFDTVGIACGGGLTNAVDSTWSAGSTPGAQRP
jgi:hypothetical protein